MSQRKSRSRQNIQDDYWNQPEVDLSLPSLSETTSSSQGMMPYLPSTISSSQAMMPYKKLSNNIFEFIKNGVEGTNKNRQLSDLNESLQNISQLPVIENLGLDAKEALLEIIDTELAYLNGNIIKAEANRTIEDLCIRAAANRHMVKTIAKSTAKSTSVIVTTATIVFYSHWNNFQSILVGICDLFKREAFDIAGLPGIVDSLSQRTDIYNFLASNNLLDFIYNLIFPSQPNAQEQQVLLQKFALSQSHNIDLIQENSGWSITNTFNKVVKGGVKVIKRAIDMSSGGRSERVKHELSTQFDYIYVAVDSAHDWLLRFLGLAILCFVIIVIYKCYRSRSVNKTLAKYEQYEHSFEFGKKKSKKLKSKRLARKPKV
jgi:hypothetical protein